MPRLLSRIEREYVINHMRDVRPALSIRLGDATVEVSERSYSIEGAAIRTALADRADVPHIADGMPCEVRFSHRKRALSFKSSVTVGDGPLRIAIPDDVYKSDEHERSDSTCRVTAWFPGRTTEFRDSSAFPLDLDCVDPEEAELSAIGMRKVIARLGVAGSDATVRAASHRLKEFFDRVTSCDNPAQWASTVLFIDESSILVALGDPPLESRPAVPEFGVSIDYGIRQIECASRVAGTVPVTGGVSLACLAYVELKPEDRRFLHEAAHREKFVG